MTASVRLVSAFPAALHADVAAALATMPSAGRVAALSTTQQTVLQCLYTRHHDGFVRQRYLQQAIGSPHAWVVPFVVQLVGEYVIEIIVAIRDALSDLDAPGSTQQALYGRFLAENPAFLELTSQRVASYWDCYYRSSYPSRADYPGFGVLSSLRAAALQQA